MDPFDVQHQPWGPFQVDRLHRSGSDASRLLLVGDDAVLHPESSVDGERLAERLADRIWLIEDGQFYEYPGGYAYYQEKHPQALARAAAATQAQAAPVKAAAAPAAPKGKGLWQLNRDAESIEAEIAALETELEAAHTALSQPAPDADFAALGKTAHDLETKLEDRMATWAQIQEEIEAKG